MHWAWLNQRVLMEQIKEALIEEEEMEEEEEEEETLEEEKQEQRLVRQKNCNVCELRLNHFFSSISVVFLSHSNRTEHKNHNKHKHNHKHNTDTQESRTYKDITADKTNGTNRAQEQ